MKNLAFNRMLAIITILMFATALLVSCSKESSEIDNNKAVDVLVEQAAQQYLNTPVPTGGEDETYSLNTSGLPEVYLATSSGFDTKVAANPLISCVKSVKLTDKQALEVRKALSVYEEQIQIFMKTQREELAKMEARFIAAKKELLKLANGVTADRHELEKKIIALKAELEKAMRAFKEKNAPILSAPYKTLMTTLGTILDKRQWEAFSKCLSR
ncbi:MAG: hypothetical protein Q8S04_07455 [Bacteroidales bacterium]|nr:hypothetical protein [Bacteroidales bacterium]